MKNLKPLLCVADIDQLAERLYPICRSITGEGVRETLTILSEYLDLSISEIPSGKAVFDWTVPQEWVVRDAWVKDPEGRKIIDFQQHNLHLVNYSAPAHGQFSLEELDQHLNSIPEHPDWIPYRTSYYKSDWGFCLTHKQRSALKEGVYEVFVDTQFKDGSLSLAEYFVQGKSQSEIVIYSHCCHPSLANDNLSGLICCTALAQVLSKQQPNFSYRIIFGPGTIGSISWLAENQAHLKNITMGLVPVLLGDSGDFRYKKSRHGEALIDRAVERVLHDRGLNCRLEDFSPYGYEERQFNSPGINIPTGRLSRSAHGQYAEYHSSADNLDFISANQILESITVCEDIVHVLDRNVRLLNLFPHGEPQLGKRGLYGDKGGSKVGNWEMAMLWVLNLADGEHDLLAMADRSKLSFDEIYSAAMALEDAGVVKRLSSRG